MPLVPATAAPPRGVGAPSGLCPMGAGERSPASITPPLVLLNQNESPVGHQAVEIPDVLVEERDAPERPVDALLVEYGLVAAVDPDVAAGARRRLACPVGSPMYLSVIHVRIVQEQKA